MYALGISAFYHDSAAALIKDGVVVAAFEEERFSRIKHDNTFPKQAIQACLSEAGIAPADLTFVSYYEKPLLKLERILDSTLKTYPFSGELFRRTMEEWLGGKLQVEKSIRDSLSAYSGPIYFTPHHLSHAAAAFYTSPFSESAILTSDGVGEYTTTALWTGTEDGIECLGTLPFPHSLGLLYSTFTAFLGFRVNNDEYKMMGLAAYGTPKYVDTINSLINVKEDGSFKLHSKYFLFERSAERMFSDAFIALFGTPRTHGEELTDFHSDIAASIQYVLEERYTHLLKDVQSKTGSKNICISGGVGLNALANGKLLDATEFEHIHIFGPAGDGGSALGTVLGMYHEQNPTTSHTYLPSLKYGSDYSQQEILESIQEVGADEVYEQVIFENRSQRNEAIGELLEDGKVGILFQGKLEFGPRALGSRSIIAKPFPLSMKDRVNEIKKREKFRPFGISVLEEVAHDMCTLPKTIVSAPYMNMCFKTKEEWRERIAAVVHHDGTTRIQTVSKEDDAEYYDVINAFYKKSGVPGVLNTSLNVGGEPLIEHPTQALALFNSQPVDFLVLEDVLLKKKH